MRKSLIVFCFILGTFFSFPAFADIMISPIYVIFDGRTRAADVTVLNTTNTANVYRLEWSVTRQREDGSYEKIDALPEGMIDPRTFVRFSPRQFTLLPQTRQLVRIQLQKPADLPDGEYRLHLNFKRLPNTEGLQSGGNQGPGIQMELRVTLGISMPIVVRHGVYSAKSKIADAKFVNRVNTTTKKEFPPELMVRVNRTGLHGTYGRLRVFWTNGGSEKLVGTLNNFSIYADNPSRVGYVRLSEQKITSGKLRIVYEGDGPQRGDIFAERLIQIGS